MANRSSSRAFSALPRLIMALSILVVVLIVVFVVLEVSGGDPSNLAPLFMRKPTERASLEETEQPFSQNKPSPTLTSTTREIFTPTATATTKQIFPTETPTPYREWTREEYYDFLLTGPGEMLLMSNWGTYDGTSIFDDYPCRFSSQNCDSEEREQSLASAYEQNKNANFYCEWACQGYARNFGYLAPISRRTVWEGINLNLGNPEVEPYCPQFSGTYDQFSCSEPVQQSPVIPLEDYGWTPEERKYVVNEFLYPILNAGWSRFPDWPYWRSEWNEEDVARLAESYVCWIVANGHFVYGWPGYSSDNVVKHFELRFQLRDELTRLLGKPRGDKSPLCPQFEEMIGEEYFP